MKKFLALVLALAPLAVVADQLINGQLIMPGTLPSSAAVTPWAPAASPTLTGTVTLPITGTTQCLHVSTGGVLSGTGSDCGSGGGSGLPTTGGTMTGNITMHTANLDGLNVSSANSLTVTPVGNAFSTLSKLSFHATTQSTTTRSFMMDLGEISATSGGTGPTGGNVTLYAGMEAQSGSGAAWAFNPLLTVDSGAGANTHPFQTIEVDFNNNDVASTGASADNGVDIDSAGLFVANTALGIGGSPGWLYGISITGVSGGEIELQGAAAWGLDTISFTGTDDIRLRNTGVIVARNAANSADLQLLTLNGSNVLQLGAGAVSDNAPVRLTASAGLSSDWNVNFGGGTTSAEANRPFQITEQPSGICNPDGGGTCWFNQIFYPSDNVDASATFNGAYYWGIIANCCGSSAKQNRTGEWIIMNFNSSPAADVSRNYGGSAQSVTVSANFGGTADTWAAAKGSFFGLNPYVVAASGATHTRGVTGVEVDLSINTGATSMSAIGMGVVADSNWAVSAVQEAVGYLLSSQASGVHPFDVMFQLGGYEGFPGVKSTGGLFRCENNQATGACPQIGYGFDLTNMSFTGNAWASPGFAIDAAGVIGNNTPGGTVTIGSSTSVYNDLKVTPATTGGGVNLFAGGVDANPILALYGGGSGALYLGNITSGPAIEVSPSGTSGSTDLWLFQSIAGGNGFAELQTMGSDANINGVGVCKGTCAWIFRPGTNGDSFKVQTSGGGSTIFDVNTANPAITNAGGLVESSIVTTTTSAPAAATTRYERCNSGSALSITFATTGMAIGQRIDVKNVNTGVCTVDSGSGHTIDGAQTFPLSTQYQNVSLLCTAVTSGTCTAWDVE